MLPAMRDMHIHLDKTFYGGPRRSLNRPAGTTIQDMIRTEQKLLPELQPYTRERAEKADRSAAIKRYLDCPQPLQHRTGFRTEKHGEPAGGAGASPAGFCL